MIHIPDSIFPKDQDGQMLCPKCQKVLDKCDCPVYEPPQLKAERFVPKVYLDKSGRCGKIVTVIKGLPADEEYLKELSKVIKKKVGGGGTFYVEEGFGIVEVQGDHLKAVEQILRDSLQ